MPFPVVASERLRRFRRSSVRLRLAGRFRVCLPSWSSAVCVCLRFERDPDNLSGMPEQSPEP